MSYSLPTEYISSRAFTITYKIHTILTCCYSSKFGHKKGGKMPPFILNDVKSINEPFGPLSSTQPNLHRQLQPQHYLTVCLEHHADRSLWCHQYLLAVDDMNLP